MDNHAAFESALQRASDSSFGTGEPVAAVGGSASEDLYASLMSKEDNVLDLIRRVDDTKRQDALRKSDRVAPLFSSFVSGISGFIARLVHYTSKGSLDEAIGLITSPDGMVYTGVLIAIVALVLMCI